jgi:hypothetical protein
MTRPYFKYSIVELEEICRRTDDRMVLRDALAELAGYRKTERAQKLKSWVEERLASMDASRNSASPRDDRSPQGDHPNESGESTGITDDPASVAEDSESDPIGAGSDPAISDTEPDVDGGEQEASSKTNGGSGRQSTLFPDEELETAKPRERTSGHIRRPGRWPDVPPKWTPEAKTDLSPNWSSDDPLLRRYEAALRALISELRRKNRGSQQVSLEDGRRTAIEGETAAYRFAWNGDIDLFEGAKVSVVADAARTSGRIVALSSQFLVISIDEDLGPTIKSCVLTIDNTAMLEALADRLKEIRDGQTEGFNTAIAEDTILNREAESALGEVPEQHLSKLNELQREAVRRASGNAVSYLWGPPGTGKTLTLTSVSRYLFSADERVLIASNTNQAVDQVLAKLAEGLIEAAGGDWAKAPPLYDGRIVRVGKLVDDGPLAPYRDLVTLGGIIERKSIDLRKRKTELESQEREVQAAAERAQAIIATFSALEAAGNELSQRVMDQKRSEIELGQQKAVLTRLTMEKAQLEAELGRIRDSGFLVRLVLRSAEVVQADLSRQTSHIQSALMRFSELEGAISAHEVAGRLLEEKLERAKAATVGLDHEIARTELARAESRLTDIQKEISDINRQIADLEKAIMDQAQIVGATATKLFLSPSIFSRFDTVILDEASMLLLPSLFHAAGLAKGRVIVSGDFRQLPPIVQSDQKAILDEIGKDVFEVAGIKEAFDKKQPLKRTTMLEYQHRMNDDICSLISLPLYGGRLQTDPRRIASTRQPPELFRQSLTIVDTSYVGPFVAKDPAGSKFNLMNALIIRNLCRYLKKHGFGEVNDIGVVVPYVAQRKLLQKALADGSLSDVAAGTVHRYQGDEKQLIIVDLTDGVGLRIPGPWLQADLPDEAGARLFNVAFSRAREHVIVVADLSWMDRRLPERALMRGWLYRMQEAGKVLDVRDALGLMPIKDDLQKYGIQFSLSAEAEKTGLFNESEFDRVVWHDLASARKGIAIWSAFITPQRVAKFAEVFRAKAAAGIPVRCVVRPPWDNGTIDRVLGEDAINALEAMGCIVDTRYRMHEKAVLIDDRILWWGSLNTLSNAGNTGEMMTRIEGEQTALQLAGFLSAKGILRTEEAAGAAYLRENPPCGCGETRAVLGRSKFGPYWRCLKVGCSWKSDIRKPTRAQGKREAPKTDMRCPKCGAPMVARHGRYGSFFGCSRFPDCDGTVNQAGSGSKGPRNPKSRKAGRESHSTP